MSAFLADANDFVVLTLLAVVLAALALGIAELTHRTFYAARFDDIDPHSKLFELVHGSLLAFVAFMLAISVTEVRSNYGKADDAVSREAMHIASLDREIGEQDPAWVAETRPLLRRYVEIVAEVEWPRLAASRPSLAPEAQTVLDELRGRLRRVPASESTRHSLIVRHDTIEVDRSIRYEHATRAVPRIFWTLIGGFLLGAMVMNGRYRQTSLTRGLVAVHFAAIGLAVALILILDAPFRGETSISPAPLVDAVKRA